MIARTIKWSLKNRIVVLLSAVLLAGWGIYSSRHMALDAVPDLSDLQVIIKTAYPGQPQQVVEDQVTFPITSELLSVPGSIAVRGFSMFGESYVYVIFEDGIDPYWARSRVLEYLSQIEDRLPDGVIPTLGPDASGVGWVCEYALVDRHHRYDADELRAVQDFFLKYELQSLHGVAEVASIGGMVRQFQIEVNPNRLAAYNLSMGQVEQAIRDSNTTGGGSVMEMGRSEFVVRAQNYLRNLDDFRHIPLGVNAQGVPIRLEDVAQIQIGPELRPGGTDLDGLGEVTGGIVVMRYGENALQTITRIKARLNELQSGLPPGIELVVTYDRSGVIKRAIKTLSEKLVEESLIVTLVCLAFLFHLRSSLVAVITLPIGILTAFIIMENQGVTANIMSLGGIAIAIGAMVDAAVVMIENMHKHLERAGDQPDYWKITAQSSLEVGPALFFSLLIITVSFLPVLTLTGQAGKLFAPLAYTKTYAMAASAILAITLAPVLMGYFIRGRITREQDNPLNRLLHVLYRPLLMAALQKRKLALSLCLVLLLSAAWPIAKLGSEFMPPLNEGDLLYMPTTLPGLAKHALDFGHLTTTQLKPQEQWPPGVTMEDMIRKLDEHVRLPGLTNSWGYPIRTRIDMLSTGIRTPLGIKVTGPDLAEVSALARQIEEVIEHAVPGTRNAFADRASGGRYGDIALDRVQAARYGVTAADVQRLVQGAIGGENIGMLIDGRNRYPINLRYPRAFRDSLAALEASRIMTPSGADRKSVV